MDFSTEDLGILGIALQEFKTKLFSQCHEIDNYFDNNDTALIEYVHDCINAMKLGIKVCHLQMRIVENLPYRKDKETIIQLIQKHENTFIEYLEFLENGQIEFTSKEY